MSRLEHSIVKILNKILGKYLNPRGIPVWGSVVKVASGDYRLIYVDDDGKLVISSIAAAVDVSDRWARQLGKVDLQRFLGSDISLANPILGSQVVSGAIVDPRATWDLNAYGVVRNPSFEYDLAAWIKTTGSDAEVVTTDPFVGNKCLRLGIGNGGLTRGEVYQWFHPPIDTDRLMFSPNRRRYYFKKTAGDNYIEYWHLYDDASTRTDHTTTAFVDTWTGQQMVFDLGKRLVCLGLRARDINVSDIFLDDFVFFAEPEVDVSDRAARQLGIVWQQEKDRVITQFDPAIFVAGEGPNGDFETGDFRGWRKNDPTDAITVRTDAAHTGIYGVRFYTSTTAYLWQFYYPAISVDGLAEFSLMVKRTILWGTIEVIVYYTDGTSSTTTFQPPGIDAWVQLQPTTVAGKYIAAVSMRNSEAFGVLCMDVYRMTRTLPVNYAQMKKLLDWAYRYTFYADPEALANNTDKFFLDSDVPTPAECVPPLKVARCLLGCDTKEVVIYVGYDDYWHGGFRADWEVTFETLHEMGGEDHLLKELRYDEVNSLFEVMVKCPLVMMDWAYLGLGNYTGGGVNVWSEGEYFVLEE